MAAAFNAPAPQPPQPSAGAAPTFQSDPQVAIDRLVAGPRPTTPAATPSASPSGPAGSQDPGKTEPADAETEPAGLVPVRLTIPRIDVDAKIMSLGIDKNGSLQVPPRSKAQFAGWYRLGPSPGEVGNAVIVGHVDTAQSGPAVFFKLGALKKGDVIKVARKDGTHASFKVDGVKSYAKSAFPTDLVYGPSDQPGLRLVTCGGPWTKKTHYRDNVIVFATPTTS